MSQKMRKNESQMLIPKTEFIGLEEITHLCVGGESPTLKSHRAAVEWFFSDKAMGEVSREHDLVEVTPRSVHMRKAVLSAQKHHNLRSTKVKKNMPVC